MNKQLGKSPVKKPTCVEDNTLQAIIKDQEGRAFHLLQSMIIKSD